MYWTNLAGFHQQIVSTLDDPRAAPTDIDFIASADLNLTFNPTPPPTLAELKQIFRAKHTPP